MTHLEHVLHSRGDIRAKENSPRAQTTCLASFEPAFVIPAQSVVYLAIRTFKYNNSLVSI